MSKYPITGTFIDEITYDIPASNWSDDEWRAELQHMQDVGIDTLIIIRGGFEDKTVFPSRVIQTPDRPDFAKLILEEAAERGMKVFFGLYISDIDWGGGDYRKEIEINEKFVDEVLERYGHLPSLHGWYVPHETGREELNITQLFRGLSGLCKDRTPDKKVLVSPFFMGEGIFADYMTPEQHFEEWDRIFRANPDIDICAFQDGTSRIRDMAAFYEGTKRLCEMYKMEHWVNVETFERDVRKQYYPIPFADLQRKINVHKNYSEKMITFEFSHFMSPQSIYPSARNLHRLYKAAYGGETE